MELTSGQRHRCTFRYSPSEIETIVHSFDEAPFLEASEPIFLLSQKMKTVSLHQNLNAGSGHVGGYSDGSSHHHQRIISNCAVIGTDPWTAEDKIKRIIFKIPGADRLFWHQEKLSTIANSKPEPEDFKLFESTADVARIRAYYTAKGIAWGDGFTDAECVFEIEFHDSVSLGDHLDYLSVFRWFFSGCLGYLLIESDRRICRYSRDEFLHLVKSRKPAHQHREIRLRGEQRDPPSHISFHSSPAWGNSDEELENMSRCLVAWTNRMSEWKDAYAHMASCLKMRNEVTSERLLSACKWLEKIPTADANKVIDRKIIHDMAKAAFDKAVELGAQIDEGRLKGVLSPVSNESHGQRFTRLISENWKEGPGRTPRNKFVRDLKASQILRGSAAHNHIDVRSQEEFALLARATASVEALCFLLTMRDLPWTEKARDRLQGHPLVLDYIHCV